MISPKNIFSFLMLAIFVLGFGPRDAKALSVDISMSPESPVPNEMVFLSVSALEFNMDLSNISWSVDEKLKESGVGKKSISVVAPANGKSVKVSVKVIPNIGGILESSVVISPAGLDILWEATDSYVPPFYRGKALPISQGEVRVVAIPNIKTTSGAIKPSNSFVYTWRKDGKNVPNASGLGKSSFGFANQLLDKQNRIEVSATDGTKSAAGAVTMTPFVPEIVFYEELTLEGVQYERALSQMHPVTEPRITIVAEPYFLSRNFKKNLDIKTVWRLNNQEAKAAQKNTMVINTSNTEGQVAVSFTYDDIRKLFRDFSKTITLNIK